MPLFDWVFFQTSVEDYQPQWFVKRVHKHRLYLRIGRLYPKALFLRWFSTSVVILLPNLLALFELVEPMAERTVPATSLRKVVAWLSFLVVLLCLGV
jgi:hypothetical protein